MLEIQKLPGMGISVLMEVLKFYRVNKSGMTDYEAIDLAHKIEFIKLCKVEAEGGDVQQAFRETIEETLQNSDDIFNEVFDKEKVALLKTLPSIHEWKQKGGVELSKKYYSTFYTD